MLGRQTELAEAVGAPGQVVPRRLAGLSASRITRYETNLDVRVEQKGPLRADEIGLVRVDKFGPTIADEDVVQEAEKLKHVPALILPSKAELEAHNVSHLPFRNWCYACVCGWGLSLSHRKVDTKTNVAEQIPTVSLWTTGSSGNWKTEHMTHLQCSSFEISRVQACGVTRCRQKV